MEPRIRYDKAADGVSIAFWALGESAAQASSSRGDAYLRLDDAALLKERRQERYRASGPRPARR